MNRCVLATPLCFVACMGLCASALPLPPGPLIFPAAVLRCTPVDRTAMPLDKDVLRERARDAVAAPVPPAALTLGPYASCSAYADAALGGQQGGHATGGGRPHPSTVK